jgi:AraC-like DNA-binding protein
VWSRAAPLLLKWLNGRGVDVCAFVQDIDREFLESAEGTTSFDQYLSIWKLSASVDPAIGLELANRIHESDFHLILQIATRSRSVRDALTLMGRYAQLAHVGFAATIRERRGRVDYVLGPADFYRDYPAIAEYHVALLAKALRYATDGLFRMSAVAFMHPCGAQEADYVSHFGCAPVFEAPETSVSFRREMLDLPLRSFSPHLAPILTAHADRLLETGYSARLSEQVRARLLQAYAGGRAPTLEAVAGELSMTASAMRRQLRAEGEPWRNLCDEARRETAADALRNGQSAAEVSDLLGYSEPAAFHHAIRRWFGATAGELRDLSARGGAA